MLITLLKISSFYVLNIKFITIFVFQSYKMTTLNIEIGLKLNLKRDAIITIGNSDNNPIVTWEIDRVALCSDGSINYVTFKGKKTEYRFCGNRIYSITGPVREYQIV